MEISYQDYLNDFTELRALGVREPLMERLESGITLLFYMINAFDELESQLGHKNALIIRLKEQLFGKGQTIDGEVENVLTQQRKFCACFLLYSEQTCFFLLDL